jgi:hypothetical protein
MNMPEKREESKIITRTHKDDLSGAVGSYNTEVTLPCNIAYNQALADVQALNQGTVCVSEERLNALEELEVWAIENMSHNEHVDNILDRCEPT